MNTGFIVSFVAALVLMFSIPNSASAVVRGKICGGFTGQFCREGDFC